MVFADSLLLEDLLLAIMDALRIQYIFLRDIILIHRCLYSGYIKGALLTSQRNQILTPFFIFSTRKGKNFQWNARSCFLEMILCLAVFHLMKASKGTESESHSVLEAEISHPHCETEPSFRIHPFWPYFWIHEPLVLPLVSSTTLVKANYDLFYSYDPTVACRKVSVAFQCRY